MTTPPDVPPLTAEEIALRDAKPYSADELALFRACASRKCGHDIVHRRPSQYRTLATIAAKDAEIAHAARYRAKVADALGVDPSIVLVAASAIVADRAALLGQDQPWPLKSVLINLANFAHTELADRSRDFDGHEVLRACIVRASDIAEGIEWNHPEEA